MKERKGVHVNSILTIMGIRVKIASVEKVLTDAPLLMKINSVIVNLVIY